MTDYQKPETTPKSVAKAAFTTVAGLTAVCYVLGFVIINTFLISHGLVTYTPLNNKYLATGICFAFFYALAGLIFNIVPGRGSPTDEWDSMVSKRNAALEYALQNARARHAHKPEEFRIGYERAFRSSFAASYTLVYTLVYAVIYLVTTFILQLRYYVVFLVLCFIVFYITGSTASLALSPFMFLWTVVVTLGTSLGADLLKRGLPEASRLVPWLLILALASAVLYGSRMYADISPSIGGGMPLSAVFVVSDDEKAEVEALLGAQLENNKTPNVKLLLETSESFVIVVDRYDDQQIRQLKKNVVRGIIHKPLD